MRHISFRIAVVFPRALMNSASCCSCGQRGDYFGFSTTAYIWRSLAQRLTIVRQKGDVAGDAGGSTARPGDPVSFLPIFAVLSTNWMTKPVLSTLQDDVARDTKTNKRVFFYHSRKM